MYRDKRIWAEIGSRLVSNLSYYNDFKISEEEIFDLIANDEYLLDDSEEVYGKRLINFLKIWEIIRTKIIESKENFKVGKKRIWSFTREDYKLIYNLLDGTEEFENFFLAENRNKEEINEMISFFEDSLIEDSSAESFLEDLLVLLVFFAIQKPLNDKTAVFIYLISNAMILYKGFGPILPTYRGEIVEISNLISRIAIQCQNIDMQHYNKNRLFNICLKRLIDICETNKTFLESL
ncbi:hypothetical protein [Spiroplasma diminutum]|uniref:Uncharacterized protein n=1 Tax=Spiroplasma diminutum CUAS-1 TaxID=1276221 RepID=S5M0I5_9MOLU|nr:hypothetical protein [Spiroplasma diminutum]AGR42366.1 hypothetical protein SDIMI_v3c06620 [Spiroplasma diminutum CUAS-1]